MQTPASKRQFLRAAGIAAVAAVIAPRMAFATAADVASEIKKLYGDRQIVSGRIKLDVPQIAETGLVVPISVEVDSPMTANDYVKSVHVFAEKNPLPGVITYRFTPEAGKAAASTRMRLAETQDIVVVAEMSSGQLFSTRSEVKVTIGGRGG